MATAPAQDPHGPACVQYVLPLVQLKAWVCAAAAGDRLIYCHAPAPIYGETWSYVGQLAAAGIVHPSNPRSDTCEGFRAFTIKVLRKQVEAPEPGGRRAAAAVDSGDDASARILLILRRAANFGRQCPTNPELAKAAGLATPNQVAWRLRKLVDRGAIQIRTIETGTDAGWRTVTIKSTGKRTMAAPSATEIAPTVPPEAECNG